MAPTLRDDVVEARDRADKARTMLAKKLAQNQTWTRDDKIMSIDGLDSLVSMAQETLPYLPNNPVHSPNNLQYGATEMNNNDPAPIVPIGTKTGYATLFPNRAAVAHKRQGLNLGSICGPESPGLPDGFDKGRPNVVLNPKTGNFDFTDVDFTGDNAGSSEREFIAAALIFLPYNQWGDVDFAAVSTGDDNRVIAPGQAGAQRFEVRGGGFNQRIEFNLKLSGPPRAGGQDWFRIMATWYPQYDEHPDLNIGVTKGINYQTGIKFFLPGTVHNKYRDAHLYSRQPNGDMSHEIVHSVDEITEHDGFLWYRGDEGWPIKIVNAADVIGTWFIPGQDVNPHFMYDIHSETAGGELGVQADALTLDGDRFAVMRQGHMDGWLDASQTYEITPKKL